MPNDVAPSPNETLDCELCIIGAGYAALNGLNVAAKYLAKGARVVVIDQNASWGGQWLGQYDFVRLHQPYRMFTAGDQPWQLQRDPTYLATRSEVLDHLASVPRVSAGHLDVVPLFGHSYRGHRIHEGRAHIDATPVAGGGASIRVRARRLLKLTGADIQLRSPFQLSSTRVRTVGVADPVLMTREFLDSNAPVYLIGSGKTAMDCVRYIKQQSSDPNRSVHVVSGSGMWFFVRDSLYPGGRRRHTHGELTGSLFLNMAQGFDGQNEIELARGLERRRQAMNVFGYGGNCRFGLLSFAERDEILRSVDTVHRGHVVDVDGTRLTIREGNQQRDIQVAEGSWFVNCTSHLRVLPHEPLIQDSGIVCAPQFCLGFTGTSAYFVTHLWFRDELAPIAAEIFRARFDVEPKLRFAPQIALMIMANMSLITPRLPISVPGDFLGDFNKWYPFYRQLPMIARINANRGKMIRKAERLLKQRFSDGPDVARSLPGDHHADTLTSGLRG